MPLVDSPHPVWATPRPCELPPSMIGRMTLIIDAFENRSSRLTLEEVAYRTRLPRSTAHRILDQLVGCQWLEHTSYGYRLGPRALGLGGQDGSRGEIREAAAPCSTNSTCAPAWWCISPYSKVPRSCTSTRSAAGSPAACPRGSADTRPPTPRGWARPCSPGSNPSRWTPSCPRRCPGVPNAPSPAFRRSGRSSTGSGGGTVSPSTGERRSPACRVPRRRCADRRGPSRPSPSAVTSGPPGWNGWPPRGQRRPRGLTQSVPGAGDRTPQQPRAADPGAHLVAGGHGPADQRGPGRGMDLTPFPVRRPVRTGTSEHGGGAPYTGPGPWSRGAGPPRAQRLSGGRPAAGHPPGSQPQRSPGPQTGGSAGPVPAPCGAVSRPRSNPPR